MVFSKIHGTDARRQRGTGPRDVALALSISTIMSWDVKWLWFALDFMLALNFSRGGKSAGYALAWWYVE